MISKVCFSLRRIYSVGVYFPFKVRKLIAKTFLVPIILYGLEIYSCSSVASFEKIKKCFNRIIRFVYGLSIRSHVTSSVFEFLGISFENYVNLRLLLFFFKTIKFGKPEYLVNFFHFAHSTRTSALISPQINTLYMQRSYVVRTVRLWNDIVPYRNRNFSLSLVGFRNLLMEIL